MANSYRSDVAVLNQGIRNAGDGLSTLQIKDGALNNISKLLDRLSTLATQSASGQPRRLARTLDQEFQDVLEEIAREVERGRSRHRAGLLGVRQQQRQPTASSAAPSARPTLDLARR